MTFVLDMLGPLKRSALLANTQQCNVLLCGMLFRIQASSLVSCFMSFYPDVLLIILLSFWHFWSDCREDKWKRVLRNNCYEVTAFTVHEMGRSQFPRRYHHALVSYCGAVQYNGQAVMRSPFALITGTATATMRRTENSNSLSKFTMERFLI